MRLLDNLRDVSPTTYPKHPMAILGRITVKLGLSSVRFSLDKALPGASGGARYRGRARLRNIWLSDINIGASQFAVRYMYPITHGMRSHATTCLHTAVKARRLTVSCARRNTRYIISCSRRCTCRQLTCSHSCMEANCDVLSSETDVISRLVLVSTKYANSSEVCQNQDV